MQNLLRNKISIDLKFWWILFSPKAQHKNDHHCHQCLSLFHIFFFHQDSDKFGLCVYWTLTATRSLYHHRSYSKGYFSGLFFHSCIMALKTIAGIIYIIINNNSIIFIDKIMLFTFFCLQHRIVVVSWLALDARKMRILFFLFSIPKWGFSNSTSGI